MEKGEKETPLLNGSGGKKKFLELRNSVWGQDVPLVLLSPSALLFLRAVTKRKLLRGSFPLATHGRRGGGTNRTDGHKLREPRRGSAKKTLRGKAGRRKG